MVRLLVAPAVAPPPPQGPPERAKVEAEAGSQWLSPDLLQKNRWLLKAAEEGQLEDVTTLLQSRANIEAKSDDAYSVTPLFLAAQCGHREIVDLLLEQKAEIEALDRCWRVTPLHKAASGGHREVIQILLEKHAEIDTKDCQEFTPLSHAARFGHREVVQILLENHAEIDATNLFECTPLSIAARFGHIEIVTLLLEKRANPISKGWPALPEAINRGDSEGVEALAVGMAEHSLWSVSVLAEIFSSDNTDMLVKALEMWPQDATQEKVQRASLPERLRAVLSFVGGS